MQASIASNWIFILFALAISAAIGAVGLYIYRKYCITFRKISPHCSLSLQFSVGQDNVFIKLCSIMAVQEDLIIICKQWIEDVNLIGCISPQLNFAWRAKLWNSFTDQATNVPQYISVKYWDAFRLNRILRLAYVVKPVIIYQEQITTVPFAATVDDARDNITFTTYNALRKANARDDEATTSDIPHYEDETEIKTKRMRAKQTQTSMRRPKKIRKQATDSEITKETTKTDNKPKTMATMTMTNEEESDNE